MSITDCPMCGAALDLEAQARACRRCPLFHLARGCVLKLIRCPSCGYHSLAHERSRPSRDAQEALTRSSELREGRDVRPLNELDPGRGAHVVGFKGLDERTLQRLVAYGLAPGVRLLMLQQRPACILKVHQTELALEDALAGTVYITPEHAVERSPESDHGDEAAAA